MVDDAYNIFNTIQPIEYGGTGSSDLSLDASNFTVKDGSDPTKRVAFNVSGISPNTTRIISVPNGAGTLMLTNTSLYNEQYLQGSVVQSVAATQNAYFGSSSIIPVDDTVPTATEGDAILSVAIIPRSATNILRYTAMIPCTRGSAGNVVAALNQGGPAIVSGISSVVSAGAQVVIVLRHQVVAGATTQITGTVRIGPGDAGVMYINGNQVSRFMGGSMRCSLTVEEIKA